MLCLALNKAPFLTWELIILEILNIVIHELHEVSGEPRAWNTFSLRTSANRWCHISANIFYKIIMGMTWYWQHKQNLRLDLLFIDLLCLIHMLSKLWLAAILKLFKWVCLMKGYGTSYDHCHSCLKLNDPVRTNEHKSDIKWYQKFCFDPNLVCRYFGQCVGQFYWKICCNIKLTNNFVSPFWMKINHSSRSKFLYITLKLLLLTRIW